MQVLDFVDYMQIGNAVAVAKGNPLGLDEQLAVRQEESAS